MPRFDDISADGFGRMSDADLVLVSRIVGTLVLPFCTGKAEFDDRSRDCRPLLATLRARLPQQAEALVATARDIRQRQGWPHPAGGTSQ